MPYDVVYTNGVIKCKEKYLLGDKIMRMADSSLEDAFRILKESGFGSDALSVEDNAYRSEVLIRAEENSVNAFIREYAPDKMHACFLLAEYDFRNAEAFIKCKYAGADEDKLLSPQGMIETQDLKNAVYGDKAENLPQEIVAAITECSALFESGRANGLEVDCIFKKQLYLYMKRCAKNKNLKAMLEVSADAANVSSAIRSRDEALTEKMFVSGGKLPLSQIKQLSGKSFAEISGGEYPREIKLAAEAAEAGNPLSEFEKSTDNFPIELLYKTRYDMIGSEPFLLYVLKRRAEIKNVRIITVSLAAGLDAGAIKNKLRMI